MIIVGLDLWFTNNPQDVCQIVGCPGIACVRSTVDDWTGELLLQFCAKHVPIHIDDDGVHFLTEPRPLLI